MLPAAAPSYGGVGRMSSFGEGIEITPLHLAALGAAFANGGTMYYLQYPRNEEQRQSFLPRVKRKVELDTLLPELRDGMLAAFTARGIATQAPGDGPIFQIYLQEEPISDYRDTLHADAARWTRFCHQMIRRGIYMNGGKVYCSAAHTDDDLRATLAACEEALDDNSA